MSGGANRKPGETIVPNGVLQAYQKYATRIQKEEQINLGEVIIFEYAVMQPDKSNEDSQHVAMYIDKLQNHPEMLERIHHPPGKIHRIKEQTAELYIALERTLTYAEAKSKMNSDQHEVLRTTSFNFNHNERGVVQLYVTMEAAEETLFKVRELQQVMVIIASPDRTDSLIGTVSVNLPQRDCTLLVVEFSMEISLSIRNKQLEETTTSITLLKPSCEYDAVIKLKELEVFAATTRELYAERCALKEENRQAVNNSKEHNLPPPPVKQPSFSPKYRAIADNLMGYKVKSLQKTLKKAEDFDDIQGLNKEQNEVVRMARAGVSTIALLGNAGSGKSRTIKEIIRQLIQDHPTIRIFVLAPSNAATDLLMNQLKEITRKIVRHYTSKREHMEVNKTDNSALTTALSPPESEPQLQASSTKRRKLRTKVGDAILANRAIEKAEQTELNGELSQVKKLDARLYEDMVNQ